MMEEKTFCKKYLGEVTTKSGEHIKFLFPISKLDYRVHETEATYIFNNLQRNQTNIDKYKYILLDDLDLEQFKIVFAATKKYRENYWKILWSETNKK